MDSFRTINPDPNTAREAAFVNYKSSPGFKLIFKKRLSLIPETTNCFFLIWSKIHVCHCFQYRMSEIDKLCTAMIDCTSKRLYEL